MEVAMTDLAVRKPGLLRMMADAFARYRRRQAKQVQFYALGEVESERVAHDLGLARTDLEALVGKEDDSASLMEARLSDNGIDIKSIELGVLRDMQRCCSQCDQKDLCEHELVDKPKAASWPSYCPNEQTMAALAAMKCH